jgi:hypothetical protein
MSEILKKHEKLIAALGLFLGSDGKDINDNHVSECIKLVEYLTVNDIAMSDSKISIEELSFLDNIYCNCKFYPEYKSKDIFRLISLVIDSVRSLTNGGFFLDKMYVSSHLYNEIIERLGVGYISGIKIFGVKIVKVPFLDKNRVFGIALSKYKNYDVSKVVVRCLLNKPENGDVGNKNSVSKPIPASEHCNC